MAAGWRRLHEEELHNLYASPNIVHVVRMGEMRNVYKIFVGKYKLDDLGVDKSKRQSCSCAFLT
jgi:hypothetical protein